MFFPFSCCDILSSGKRGFSLYAAYKLSCGCVIFFFCIMSCTLLLWGDLDVDVVLDFGLPPNRSTIGARRTEVEVDASLLQLDATKFPWVSNKVLLMRSDYRTHTDLDELDLLLLDGVHDGEEWSFQLVGNVERACSGDRQCFFLAMGGASERC